MRIAIDGTPLLLRSAGVKNYLYHWIAHLRRLAGEEQIRIFPFLDDVGALNHEGPPIGRWGALSRLGLLAFLNVAGDSLSGAVAARAVGGGRARVDIFHASNLMRHAPRGPRLTATIHDLTCWIYPELQKRANIIADQRFAANTLARADRTIAVSEHTRQDAIRLLRLNPEKIEVIHHGVADAYFEARPQEHPGKPYMLCLGTVEPRKNIDRLLEAYLTLPDSIREHYGLVVVGPRGWAAPETMARLRDPDSGVQYLGYVPEGALPELMASAVALVCPSLYEGFGFPVAQAMAAGVPVVASNVSALPEIAGGAALLVDPLSVSEIRSALDRVLSSSSLREELSRLGRVQAERFRWERNARESLQFFEKAMGA
jgi:glycosyltransferase involved in cell wall biosynthesis